MQSSLLTLTSDNRAGYLSVGVVFDSVRGIRSLRRVQTGRIVVGFLILPYSDTPFREKAPAADPMSKRLEP
jgi:hypothetical protein